MLFNCCCCCCRFAALRGTDEAAVGWVVGAGAGCELAVCAAPDFLNISGYLSLSSLTIVRNIPRLCSISAGRIEKVSLSWVMLSWSRNCFHRRCRYRWSAADRINDKGDTYSAEKNSRPRVIVRYLIPFGDCLTHNFQRGDKFAQRSRHGNLHIVIHLYVM